MSTESIQSEGSTAVTAASKPRAPRADGKQETYKERSVRLAWMAGSIKCPKPAHFTLKEKEGSKFKVCERLPLQQILAAMVPFKDAACDCERDACQAQWSSSSPGCYQTEWVNPGLFRKGVNVEKEFNANMPPKRIFPLRFALTKEERADLHARYPLWIFISVGSDNHDHPVAHASAQLNSFLLLESLPAGKYLDLHGNPTANERFNSTKRNGKRGVEIDTVVQLATAKDYIRQATKWGPAVTSSGKERYFHSDIRDLPSKHADRMAKYDGLLSIHTLYYYREMAQLTALIDSTRSKTLTAIIHKFDGTKGNMNSGEQTWSKTVKDGITTITQKNVHTNETYEHPSPDIWFNSKAWAPKADAEGNPMLDARALAWTMNRQCDGSFILTIVAVPKRAAILDPTCAIDMEDVVAVARPKINSPDSIEERQTVIFELHGQRIETVVEPAHFKLFDEMRSRKVTRPMRNEKEFLSFSQLWLQKSKSLMVDKKIEIDSEQLSDLILASYWVDAPKFNMSSASSALNGLSKVPMGTWKSVLHSAILVARASSVKGAVLTLAEKLHADL